MSERGEFMMSDFTRTRINHIF